MPFNIIRQDITKMKVDAVVNAANTRLKMGGGVCGAIFRAAGAEALQAACDKLAPIETGKAVITPGFDLPAKFIIHTAGPIYNMQTAKESERLLRSSYTESLRLAVEYKCESIAFPLISGGIYGYPKDQALQVATSAIRDFLKEQDIDIYLVLFDKSAFVIGRELLGDVKSYIDEHYVERHEVKRERFLGAESRTMRKAKASINRCFGPMYESADAATTLDDVIGNLDEPFSDMLLRLIDSKGMTDVEVYKRANLDRRLFSKIRSGKGYMPSKRTAIAIAVALKLSLEETEALLKRAGYALSHAVKFDVIVEYFIINGKYDIFQINEVLFEYDQPLLGN
ncbi:MAG TPA: macro domain-containing protein [Clostridia bacterium]|jgi:O-acetyl-ADP-ribose deacetylase (regulator of RNase III)/transcriptional regulator with XRE-family HTH domain|nr:RNase III inhibitor [Clostridiaceae bacterium]HOF26533.1 macro domain-containing protein [Clostridia bacterium]HOM34493.1 macro domain-containing protein [Clostridia bacterium]HOR90073.1 macro domain-containing protein [Clostridia bacterium]HOT70310.1 macro domain-containing protein [Clostridia bacterium]